MSDAATAQPASRFALPTMEGAKVLSKSAKVVTS
jgi:hypothetical protein